MTCTVSEYILPDGTCAPDCPPGTTNGTLGSILACNGTCPLLELYYNYGCVSTCPIPFFSFSDPISHNLRCILCNGTESYLLNGSCVSTCPRNTTNTTIDGINYCKGFCNGTDSFFNGSCYASCPSPYHQWNDPESSLPYCVLCDDNYYALPDMTCVQQCPNGLNQSIVNGLNYCVGFCGLGLFYQYRNQTCLTTCSSPYSSYQDSLTTLLYCEICSGTQAIMPDFSCVTTCPFGMNNETLYGEFYCRNICPANIPYYFNNTCYSACPSGTLFYTNETAFVWQCYYVLSLINFVQISNTELLLQFNGTVVADSFARSLIGLYQGNTTILVSSYKQTSLTNISIFIETNASFFDTNFTLLFHDGLLACSNMYCSYEGNLTLRYRDATPEPAISEGVKQTFEIISQASVAASAISVLASGSSFGFRGQISLVQYLMSFLFLNVDYPQRVVEFFQIFKIAKMQFVPNPFEWIFGDLISRGQV